MPTDEAVELAKSLNVREVVTALTNAASRREQGRKKSVNIHNVQEIVIGDRCKVKQHVEFDEVADKEAAEKFVKDKKMCTDTMNEIRASTGSQPEARSTGLERRPKPSPPLYRNRGIYFGCGALAREALVNMRSGSSLSDVCHPI